MFPDDSDYHMLFIDNGSIFIHRDWRERFKEAVLESESKELSERMLIIMGACILGGIERAKSSSANQAAAFRHYLEEEFKKEPPNWSDEPIEEPKPKNIGDGPRLLDL